MFSSYSTYVTYEEWKQNPIITTVSTTSYPIEDVEYPAITICSQGASKSILEVVLLQQFEEYLRSKDLFNRTKKNRTKRSVEPRTFDKLSFEEVWQI